MPRVSEKHKLIDNLKQTAIDELIKLELAFSDYEQQLAKETEIIDDLIFSLTTAEHFRYAVPFVSRTLPSGHHFLTNILPNLDENQFRDLMRVSWSEFKFILDLIKDDNVFMRRHNSKQFPVAMQLMIVLYRLGVSGDAGSINKIASFFEIGDGGTISGITGRIFTAILNLEKKYIYWPDVNERRQLVQETLYELPDCIGYVHCTNIKLAEPPFKTKLNYYVEEEHIYAIKLQAICDHRLRIRHLVTGYPGSADDSAIYNECALAINAPEYFEGSQWLAGDSRYNLTPTVITPHQTDECISDQLSGFNRTLNKYRIRIEKCFSLLTERFSSLKDLKIQIRKDEAIEQVRRWITVCAILHNIVLSQQREEPNKQEEPATENTDEACAGEIKRQKLMGLIGVLND